MKGIYTYTKISLLLLVLLAAPVGAQAQIAVTGAAATAKVANMSLAEGIARNSSLLLELVTRAGLMPLLSTHESYTFFVPSEQALSAYRNASPDELKAFLGQHIIASSLTAADLRDGTDIRNINGTTLRVYRKKDALLVDGIRVTAADKFYTNGVWHQLNGAFQAKRPAY